MRVSDSLPRKTSGEAVTATLGEGMYTYDLETAKVCVAQEGPRGSWGLRKVAGVGRGGSEAQSAGPCRLQKGGWILLKEFRQGHKTV